MRSRDETGDGALHREAGPGGRERGARPRRVRGARGLRARLASLCDLQARGRCELRAHRRDRGGPAPTRRGEGVQRVPGRDRGPLRGASRDSDTHEGRLLPAVRRERGAMMTAPGAPAVVWPRVGWTEVRYPLGCIEDLHEMRKDEGEGMALGTADEQKPAAEG